MKLRDLSITASRNPSQLFNPVFLSFSALQSTVKIKKKKKYLNYKTVALKKKDPTHSFINDRD